MKTPTLNTIEAAAYLGISPANIRAAVCRKNGPAHVIALRKGTKTGATEFRFTKGDLKYWQRAKIGSGRVKA